MSNAEGLKKILATPENGPVVRKFVLTTILMIVVPIAVFFGVRNIASETFGLDSGGSNLWAGISSAISVNVVMVFYVVMAWKEQVVEKKED